VGEVGHQIHRDVVEEGLLNHKVAEELPHQKEEAEELPQTGQVDLTIQVVVHITGVEHLLSSQAALVLTVWHQTS